MSLHDAVESIPTQGDHKIVSIESTAMITDCLHLFIKNHIRSMPVTENGVNVGMVDLWDLIHYLIHTFTDEELKQHNIPLLLEFQGQYIRAIADPHQKIYDVPPLPDEAKLLQFRSAIVQDAVHHPFTPLSRKAPIGILLGTMSSQNLQRVPIVSEDAQVLSIVTQLDFIRWALSSQTCLEALRHIDFSDAVVKEPYYLHQDRPTLEAFRIIATERISGLPIVNSNMQVLGNISKSDLSIILDNGEDYLNLFLPLSQFLQKISSRDGRSPDDVVCIDSPINGIDLLRLFVDRDVHRVYVVTTERILQGVISVTNIIRVLGTSLLSTRTVSQESIVT